VEIPVSDRKRALVAFLQSKAKGEGPDFIRTVVIRKMGKGADPALVKDLVQAASLNAFRAKSPPRFRATTRGWVARLTRRAITHYLRGTEDDKEYVEHLICKYLEGLIGDDPRRVETFSLMMQHHVQGFSLRELAEANGTTPVALTNRFYKLREELAPKIAIMDDEKKRRGVFLLLLLLFFGVVALVVFLAWPAQAPEPPAPPASAIPTASATSRVGDLPVAHPAPTETPATEQDSGGSDR
jgi:hypothetical protein